MERHCINLFTLLLYLFSYLYSHIFSLACEVSLFLKLEIKWILSFYVHSLSKKHFSLFWWMYDMFSQNKRSLLNIYWAKIALLSNHTLDIGIKIVRICVMHSIHGHSIISPIWNKSMTFTVIPPDRRIGYRKMISFYRKYKACWLLFSFLLSWIPLIYFMTSCDSATDMYINDMPVLKSVNDMLLIGSYISASTFIITISFPRTSFIIT